MLKDKLKTVKNLDEEHLKNIFKEEINFLKEKHLKEKSGLNIVSIYTDFFDTFLISILDLYFKNIDEIKDSTIIAVGGYGRGELNISSDLDILLLHEKKTGKKVEEATKKVLYFLWDLGFEVGFSIRTVKECFELAKNDLNTKTSFIDMRYIYGNNELYEKFKDTVDKKIFSKREANKFAKVKIEENEERKKKFGSTVYTLEPNVKTGEGGLRDYHTALWIAKATLKEEGLNSNIITKEEKVRLNEALDFMYFVRNELHFNNKKNDQLTFEDQLRIADLLGFKNKSHSLAVEQFMELYYFHSARISNLSRILISRIKNLNSDNKKFWLQTKELDDNFSSYDKEIILNKRKSLKKNPILILKAFRHFQLTGLNFSQSLSDSMLETWDYFTEEFITSNEAGLVFQEILKGKRLYETLKLMHEHGILGRYIPEFNEIRCKVQHDRYHVYTVDIHTLFAIRELELLKTKYKEDFEKISTIALKIDNRIAIVLGVLFHDIGKFRGKGHAEKGAKLVPVICKRIGIDKDTIELIQFLVLHHLTLPNLAQYRDLHDEQMIINFAKTVKDKEHLAMLYVLTFADVRAVGPEVWTGWKAGLFEELYDKTKGVLARGDYTPKRWKERAEEVKKKVVPLISKDLREISDEILNELPVRYFFYNSPRKIARHMKMIEEGEREGFSVLNKQFKSKGFTEIALCTNDVHGLFSMVTGVMLSNNVNILGAQIYTLKRGFVLDVLQVTTKSGKLLTDEHKINKIKKDLFNVITNKIWIEDYMKNVKPSFLDSSKSKPKVNTLVKIDNDISDDFTILEIHAHDKLGLLYTINKVIVKENLTIHVAKINTNGDEAIDIFYLKDIFGHKITNRDKLGKLIDSLYENIENFTHN